MHTEPTYNQLEKGKSYDIQVFSDLPSRIGTVITKEKGKKDQPGSLLIEFQRPPVYIDKKGLEVKQSTRYQIWVMGDYPIYSYRELSHDTKQEETEKDITTA